MVGRLWLEGAISGSALLFLSSTCLTSCELERLYQQVVDLTEVEQPPQKAHIVSYKTKRNFEHPRDVEKATAF